MTFGYNYFMFSSQYSTTNNLYGVSTKIWIGKLTITIKTLGSLYNLDFPVFAIIMINSLKVYENMDRGKTILIKRLDSLLGYAKTGIYNHRLKVNVYNYLLRKSPKPGWWECRSLGRGVTKDWSRKLRGLGWVFWGCRLGRKIRPPPNQR